MKIFIITIVSARVISTVFPPRANGGFIRRTENSAGREATEVRKDQ